ncbi:MAG: FtsW/RodA/SpoVE family cell cycle protein [Candidatus Gottesmanbacteria bacterium]|nr:FtsW/RodA/SpoVE family cell cycle protein [Candidatus Gottesmanbacteria bacterium]
MGKFARTIDWVDLVLFLTVGSFGLSILLSVNQELFLQQLMILIIALCVGAFVAVIDSTLMVWAAPLGYIVSLVLLAVSYIGPAIRGATRWFSIGGIQLQPSELVKPLLLLSFAWALKTFPPRSVKNILIHMVLFIIPFLLVFRQPDLGSSIVYGVMWLSMMIAAGFPVRYVTIGFLVVTLLLPVGWRGLHEYQRARIVTFINPGVDPKGTGYNAIQAMIAVGSGQLFGRGLGRGTQSHLRFLPEYHTDFIFATLVEELGFLGGSILLVAYGALLWRIIRPLVVGVISAVVPFVFSVGLFSMILTQIVINAGMNMGLIPITGITLPLVSFGGSSLLSLAVCYGMLWSVRRGKDDVIESLQ